MDLRFKVMHRDNCQVERANVELKHNHFGCMTRHCQQITRPTRRTKRCYRFDATKQHLFEHEWERCLLLRLWFVAVVGRTRLRHTIDLKNWRTRHNQIQLIWASQSAISSTRYGTRWNQCFQQTKRHFRFVSRFSTLCSFFWNYFVYEIKVYNKLNPKKHNKSKMRNTNDHWTRKMCCFIAEISYLISLIVPF